MRPDLFQDVQPVLLVEPQIQQDQAGMCLFEVATQLLPEAVGTFCSSKQLVIVCRTIASSSTTRM
jgi:hypothetical protein